MAFRSLEKPRVESGQAASSQARRTRMQAAGNASADGPTGGGAMHEGIVNLFGGAGSPEDIVKGMKDAAATL